MESNFFSGKYKTDVTKLSKVKEAFYHAFFTSSVCCKYGMTLQKVGGEEGSLLISVAFVVLYLDHD